MLELPPVDEMYAALRRRDPAFDGVFFLGVRTTGIFCRPVCSARKPRPENVEYFRTSAAAERAGYRACKRCRPLEAPGSPEPWLQRLVAELEADSSKRISDADLVARGIVPQTARRVFRARFGMTFHAYQRALRLGVAMRQLQRGDGIDGVGADVGFESTSGFRDAFERIFGAPPGRARGSGCIVSGLLSSPLGAIVVAATPCGVCLVEFADRRALVSEARRLERRHGLPVVPGRNEHLERLARQLEQYFAGERTAFEVPLDARATAFQRLVWDALLEIPCGATLSYGGLAAALGRPGASRAVGRANGTNPISILVPCHRVVQADGSLRGYGGGLWRKRRLLDHEAAMVARLGDQSRGVVDAVRRA